MHYDTDKLQAREYWVAPIPPGGAAAQTLRAVQRADMAHARDVAHGRRRRNGERDQLASILDNLGGVRVGGVTRPRVAVYERPAGHGPGDVPDAVLLGDNAAAARYIATREDFADASR